MKFKFDPSLEYQRDAVDAVVNLFDGQPFVHVGALLLQSIEVGGLFDTELGIGNRLTLEEVEILNNLRIVQESNGIEKTETLQGMNFSVEMETGTGKTYVYLRTIFELNRIYGMRKFIIVVPSVAIREGVLKSIDLTKDHFETLYGKIPFDYFVYDAKRLEKVRQFSANNHIQIMVINIQSFQKDVAEKKLSELTEDELKKLNVINRENDRMFGRRPIEFIQVTNPIVIIDEPQSVDNTKKSRSAIRNLNPLVTLRYSATHRNPYNLIYRLDPVRAYDLRLVKRIEVASVCSEENFNDAYVKLLETDNTKGIRARVEIHSELRSGLKPVRVWVKQGDNLYDKSGERYAYRDGYIVKNIDCTPGLEYIEFNQGIMLERGQEIGDFGDDLMRTQVYETVEQHLKKERMLKDKGIKVLSLFFIDRVANYRVTNGDGASGLGKIGLWFEEAYQSLAAKPIYRGLIPFGVNEVHGGYFSQDREGRFKDTLGNSVADETTYNLIMRDKERLLDPNVALRFIFSHSALREGWDNPNVFQICTLNETQSREKKRQEIGRGLRLAVNEAGERVHDATVNRLTVIANESYEDFAQSLQTEIENDFNIQFGSVSRIAFAGLVATADDGTERRIGQEQSARIWAELVERGYLNESGNILGKFNPNNPLFNLEVSPEFVALKAGIIDTINRRVFKNRILNARERRELQFHKEVQLNPDFQELWERIKQRTRYRVAFDTTDLINRALSRIRVIPTIKPARVATTVVEIDMSEAGVSAENRIARRTQDVEQVKILPDILAILQKETELTRHTLAEILKRSGRLAEFKVNPQAFVTSVGQEIARAMNDLMLEGIKYEKMAGTHWEQSRIEKEAAEGVVRYLSNLYEVQNQEKCPFDAVEYESEVERQFARDLDNNESVKLFVKLPSWFRIDTPIGAYNPDWAFVTERDEKLYFVCETKSTLESESRRAKENRKIACGRKHFVAIGVDYDVVTSLSEVGT